MPDTPRQHTPRIEFHHRRELALFDDRGIARDPDETCPTVEPARSELDVLRPRGDLDPGRTSDPVAPRAPRVADGTCSSYRPGHQTHHIMARRFHQRGRPGMVVGFDGDVMVVRAVSG